MPLDEYGAPILRDDVHHDPGAGPAPIDLPQTGGAGSDFFNQDNAIEQLAFARRMCRRALDTGDVAHAWMAIRTIANFDGMSHSRAELDRALHDAEMRAYSSGNDDDWAEVYRLLRMRASNRMAG